MHRPCWPRERRVSNLPVTARSSVVPLYSLRERLPLPVWILHRVVRVVLVTSAFAGFWIGAVLLAWFVLPVVALVAGRERMGACQRVVASAFRFFHRYMQLLGLLEVDIVGRGLDDAPRGPVVFVANHTTLVDVTAIVSRVPRLCCVAKATYAASPFVGRLLALSGFIDSGSTVAARAASVDEAVRRLAEGFHVLVFPEGSRSPEAAFIVFIAVRSRSRVERMFRWSRSSYVATRAPSAEDKLSGRSPTSRPFSRSRSTRRSNRDDSRTRAGECARPCKTTTVGGSV